MPRSRVVIAGLVRPATGSEEGASRSPTAGRGGPPPNRVERLARRPPRPGASSRSSVWRSTDRHAVQNRTRSTASPDASGRGGPGGRPRAGSLRTAASTSGGPAPWAGTQRGDPHRENLKPWRRHLVRRGRGWPCRSRRGGVPSAAPAIASCFSAHTLLWVCSMQPEEGPWGSRRVGRRTRSGAGDVAVREEVVLHRRLERLFGVSLHGVGSAGGLRPRKPGAVRGGASGTEDVLYSEPRQASGI